MGAGASPGEFLEVRRSPLVTAWFGWYSRRLFRRFFNSVRVFMEEGLTDMALDAPAIFYANHAYWWDGFWSQLCTEEFFRQNLHIIIEHRQLKQHRFFTRLGAFSIDRDNPRSAVRTLAYAARMLSAPSPRQNALWIFPQGRIEPVDRRPLVFYRGTASIVQRVLAEKPSLYLVSVVSRIEYLEEQKPELFLSFRTPQILTPDRCPEPGQLTALMETETAAHLDELKEKIMARKLDAAVTLLQGTASINRRVEAFRRFAGLGENR